MTQLDFLSELRTVRLLTAGKPQCLNLCLLYKQSIRKILETSAVFAWAPPRRTHLELARSLFIARKQGFQ
jgi:hypothetical protein